MDREENAHQTQRKKILENKVDKEIFQTPMRLIRKLSEGDVTASRLQTLFSTLN